MRQILDWRAAATGTLIAAVAIGASFALAAYGFDNLYYASVFMPFSMLACLALAWFSFLRSDGFGRRPAPADGRALPEPRPAEPIALDVSADAATIPGATPGGLDPSLYAPKDGSLVAGRATGSLGRAAFLWAALELGAAAALLHSVAGVGATFFK